MDEYRIREVFQDNKNKTAIVEIVNAFNNPSYSNQDIIGVVQSALEAAGYELNY